MQLNFIILGIIGTTELILIVVIIFILFGYKKIPDIMKNVGKNMKDVNDIADDIDKINKIKKIL